MTIKLCGAILSSFSKADDINTFFNNKEIRKINDEWMPREQAILKDPQKSCHTNLFFGFFFD
ncbi:hypothetical protein, partial [Janthinobacterium agaricidamnosum]